MDKSFWVHVWQDNHGHWVRVHYTSHEETQCFRTRADAMAWVRSLNPIELQPGDYSIGDRKDES